MRHSTDRILTTHVGSLIRPPALVKFIRAKADEQPYDEQAYLRCLRDSVGEAVRAQAASGIDIPSDGEFGKGVSWSRYVLERLTGYEARVQQKFGELLIGGLDRERFREFYLEYDKAQGIPSIGKFACVGPIKYVGQAAIQRDIVNFKAAIEGLGVEEAFMPAVAPSSVNPDRIEEYYRDDEAYAHGVAEALRAEYRAIIEAGFILQIDDARVPSMYEAMIPSRTLDDFRRWMVIQYEALNYALRGFPEDRIRYHICWGSWNGPHTADVPLKEIVDLVLTVRAGAYSIESANVRHEHEWRVWQNTELPEGKLLLPGVIAHTTNVVEHPELVAERLVRFAELVGRENLIASTDCGFAQGPFVQRVHPSIMWAKFHALVEGANLASRELWRK
jgi:5-methyltetrahydropteroyltriglutamate--homocysteine methyltransferase